VGVEHTRAVRGYRDAVPGEFDEARERFGGAGASVDQRQLRVAVVWMEHDVRTSIAQSDVRPVFSLDGGRHQRLVSTAVGRTPPQTPAIEADVVQPATVGRFGARPGARHRDLRPLA
jgi:hypothetical protein